MRIQELLLYRNMDHDSILKDMTFIVNNSQRDDYLKEELQGFLFDCVNRLLKLASEFRFEGNLWHVYLAYLLVNSENAYSTACEIKGAVEGTVNLAAAHDFEVFKELFDIDLNKLGADLEVDCLNIVELYQMTTQHDKNCISQLAGKLSKARDPKIFKESVTDFYREFGVGKYGLHKAFRLEGGGEEGNIVPITDIADVHLNDLVGYEIPKQKLIDNTEAFIKGKRANNCLLFGDAGTGKSTCIKAILNQYYDQGLRIIEIYKHQFRNLSRVIAQIKNRNYKFIIYMDDLSFEEFETEYKYLKAIIEGGLEKKPDNVLIYATSNRRHLVREEVSDKEGRREDMHASDTVQEKLSLVARFGVTIFFIGPGQKEYQEIVLELAKRNDLEMEEEELLLAANKWELSHGGRSGRTAQQFIDYLLGKM
ncbi:MAG: ATP-binding protein [Lachnospiraceae bacterium]